MPFSLSHKCHLPVIGQYLYYHLCSAASLAGGIPPVCLRMPEPARSSAAIAHSYKATHQFIAGRISGILCCLFNICGRMDIQEVSPVRSRASIIRMARVL